MTPWYPDVLLLFGFDVFVLLPISNIPFVVVVEDRLVHRLGAQ
jgi:hypothetical protein